MRARYGSKILTGNALNTLALLFLTLTVRRAHLAGSRAASRGVRTLEAFPTRLVPQPR